MTGVPSVRRFDAAEWRVYRALRLRGLADAPDAFGSTLALEDDRPDRHWAERLAAGVSSATDLPLLAEVGVEPAGLAWGRIEPERPATAHLYQMWVAPEHRRAGLGEALLDGVVRWARLAGARRLELGVTSGDSAATRLYARAGFEAIGAPEPLRDGSALLAQRLRLELRPTGR